MPNAARVAASTPRPSRYALALSLASSCRWKKRALASSIVYSSRLSSLWLR